MHPNIEEQKYKIKMKKLLIIIGVALCASLYASKSNEDIKSVDVTIAATTDTVASDTVSIPVDTTKNVNESEK